MNGKINTMISSLPNNVLRNRIIEAVKAADTDVKTAIQLLEGTAPASTSASGGRRRKRTIRKNREKHRRNTRKHK
ncbi:MAG: hypothetical protein WCJ61_11205 [Paludibacter sp.]